MAAASQKKKLQKQQLKEIGAKLLQMSPPTSKDALIKLLKQAATCLSELDQSPSPSMLESMLPCLNAIAKPELLKNQDRDVKLLVATCICEITRITAPEAPYSDDVLRDMFHLIVGTFSGLGDSESPSFGRRVLILETLARYRSCLVMLDLQCHDLVNEMFSTFFAVASDDHPESVLTSMQTIMRLLLEESEDIQENLLFTILSVLGRAKRDASVAARRLAMNVVGQSAGKLESRIKQFLISSISGDNKSSNNQLDYHEVIYDIYCCAPQILLGVIPYLTGELLADQLNTRLKTVRLLGDLFALRDPISEAFHPIFSEFLQRLTDRVVEVRMSVVEHLKICLLSNPSRVEAPQIIASLCDRLLDYDENVRKLVVGALCDVACHSLKSIASGSLRLVAERLRDKSLLVKRYTMERIAEIYKIYCLTCSECSISASEFEWIPGKILRCFYDKDVRSETIEAVLSGSLFPIESTVKDKVKQWLTVFTRFDKVEVKALEKILEQKQRLQQEMQKYLSLRQMFQDGEASELQKKILLSFRIMSRWFIDPARAEDNFRILDQLKDASVWKILTNLLDSKTSFHKAWTSRDDLLKILGEEHPLFDFMAALSMKCSYLLFDKECVKEILLEINTQKSAGETQFVLSCMNLLVIFARFSPNLLSGTEKYLVSFLKDDDEILKEGALHILARAGGTIRERLAVASSSVDLILERLCLEGSRKQAKYAVHALAAITEDDGLKSLSVLYKSLVDMLSEKTNLPAILQSLGCIAQIAMPIFETRESEVVGFITSNILECSNKTANCKTSWDERSQHCLLKIYGLKTLVKSYLPVNDAHLRPGIENFLRIIKNILSIGEVSAHVQSSPVDKAHMKLASAKAVLRLSRHWDDKIPIDVFHLTLRTSENIYPEARKHFLGKVHQYIREKLLDVKYACALLYTINGAQSLEFKEYEHNLAEVIQMCYQAKARQHPLQCNGNPLMTYPEYILPYYIHSVAHHSSCPNIDTCVDAGAFEAIYRQLHLFLSLLMNGNEDGTSEVGNEDDVQNLSAIISILRSINCSEDIVDTTKSKNSHAICDLGLSIIKGLRQKQEELIGVTAFVPLPLTLYVPHQRKEGDDTMANEEQTWLVRDSVLAHFETLKQNVTVAEDVEVINDDEDEDENDVPLGQMIKSLKAQGPKTKRNKKKEALLSETKNTEKDFDILGMVREINLDGLERSKISESGNNDEYISSGEVDDQNNVLKVLALGKRKRQKAGESISHGAPKQKRSTQDIHKSPHSKSQLKGLLKASKVYYHETNLPSYQSNEREEAQVSYEAKLPSYQSSERKEAQVVSTDAVSMEEDLNLAQTGLVAPTTENFSKLKNEGTGHDLRDTSHIIGEACDPELKIPMQGLSDKHNSTFKSCTESVKKRKRSIGGLAKCSSKGGENHSLAGCRIKVWWPLDKRFYEGLVQSYDPGMKKHEILYDDGDSEVLDLDKETWELINDGLNSRKQLNSIKNSLTKGMSPEHKKNNSAPSSLQQRNKSNKKGSSSSLRWIRAPKKGVEQKQSGYIKDILETEFGDVESRGISDLGNSEPPVVSKADETYSGDFERQEMEESGRILADAEDNNEGESNYIEKQGDNIKLKRTNSMGINKGEANLDGRELHEEKHSADAEKCDKEEKSDFAGQKVNESEKMLIHKEDKSTWEGIRADTNGTSLTDPKNPDKKKFDASILDDDTEDSDDEPLCVWKRRAEKGRAA